MTLFDTVREPNKRNTRESLPTDLNSPGARYTVDKLLSNGQLPDPEDIIKDLEFIDECVPTCLARDNTRPFLDFIGYDASGEISRLNKASKIHLKSRCGVGC